MIYKWSNTSFFQLLLKEHLHASSEMIVFVCGVCFSVSVKVAL